MIAAHVALAASARAALINPGFETGDYTGWTAFVTENGVTNAEVSPFDVSQDGTSSFAASFSTGWDEWDVAGAPHGGGIYQEFYSAGGSLEVRMDVAAAVQSSNPNLVSTGGGDVRVLIDQNLIFSHTFGYVLNNTVAVENVWAAIELEEGLHTITILFARDAFPSTNLRQYVDDVSLSGTAIVPVPAALILLISSILTLPLVRRSQLAEQLICTVQDTPPAKCGSQ